MRILLILLIIAACGNGMQEWADAEEDDFDGPHNILNNWQGTSEDPALKNVEVYQVIPAYHYLSCPGTYQAGSNPNNLAPGMMRINSTESNRGTISFGPLAWEGASNPNCELFSEEILDYTIENSVLTVCLRPASTNQCFTYSQI